MWNLNCLDFLASIYYTLPG
ncbi:hypothetical protein JGI25_00395 [Candidatus Kryptobacter tengchongensis]|uniref:Uncharacterized protein n=1 Tax=Kryptobacter tengchongensis TaxID=1643429 RepID=A0A916PDW6_KRYT1|nr:hypothetical protein JGI25_00395 [Candidatus Kryptobacter tengchongensis]